MHGGLCMAPGPPGSMADHAGARYGSRYAGYANEEHYLRHMYGAGLQGSAMATAADGWDQFQPGQPMMQSLNPILSTAPNGPSYRNVDLEMQQRRHHQFLMQQRRPVRPPPADPPNLHDAFQGAPLAPTVPPKLRDWGSEDSHAQKGDRHGRSKFSDSLQMKAKGKGGKGTRKGEQQSQHSVLHHGSGSVPSVVLKPPTSTGNLLTEAVSRVNSKACSERIVQNDEGSEENEKDDGFQVRNTFIEQRQFRSPSLEPFLRERMVKSLPPSPPVAHELDAAPARPYEMEDILGSAGGLGSAIFDGLGSGIFETPTASISEAMLAGLPGASHAHMSAHHQPFPPPAPMGWSPGFGPSLLQGPAMPQASPLDLLVEEFNAGCPAPRRDSVMSDFTVGSFQGGSSTTASLIGNRSFPSSGWGGDSSPCHTASNNGSNTGSGEMPGETKAAPKSDKPPLGSPELPSRGSALHRWNACKPCAFVFAEGCQNAVECQFCHLCDAGEKKRRKKERQTTKKEVRDEFKNKDGRRAPKGPAPTGRMGPSAH
eukprot:gb/GFBE01006783.1/.p1 GENE.gb/GFBE01006783.1/~~gb/GFBE01006783.1/.p1  ORF type:complete len:540 (+),score=58.05 gb/GFBE01006783.1/:1-1620(+)